MKKATGIVRRFDQLGRIVVPKELRDIFNLQVNDPVEIFVNDNNEIVLKKYEPACIFCASTEDVVIYNGRQICKDCIEKLTSALSNLKK